MQKRGEFNMVGEPAFYTQFLVYVKNTAGNATIPDFYEDYKPVGESVWQELADEGLVKTVKGKIVLTEKGESVLADST
jgi:ribosomal protein S19E (S16A)